MKNIFYVGYYANSKYRNCPPSAKSKMDYVIESIEKLDYEINIISASCAKKGKFRWIKKENLSNRKIMMQNCIMSNSKILNAIMFFKSKIWFFGVFLLAVKKEDVVIVYHSLGYYKIISILKKIIGFKLILEIEEIYSDVTGNKKNRNKELEFFKLADAFIFPTELLNECINEKNKPAVIVYGTYKVEYRTVNKFRDIDNRIHLVYAGTFDPRKGGAITAIKVGEFLDDHYHIHIIGFGSEEENKIINKYINQIRKKTSTIITMDGLLMDNEYLNFLQQCDVGFSTQTPESEFNDTSFPSKILSYLSNGLRVVSIKINVLKKSKINDLLYYYEENKPQKIAEIVKQININEKYDSRQNIKILNDKFLYDLQAMINILNK